VVVGGVPRFQIVHSRWHGNGIETESRVGRGGRMTCTYGNCARSQAEKKQGLKLVPLLGKRLPLLHPRKSYCYSIVLSLLRARVPLACALFGPRKSKAMEGGDRRGATPGVDFEKLQQSMAKRKLEGHAAGNAMLLAT